ncbi:type IV pilus assembly protein PilM [Legionella fallonii]|uniref:Type IV pilus assembly protein PilM n=1 Tax=Legionella fallonii LLAP-10 TaxID=1212491 RepID=A0A098G1T4_9GAMM|nr:type IV pilus assembly protein PilM [Legionella fallonii]CEG56443.1 Type IV pilus assembly protein PilM [Legionella fallonii LLAP-10]
MLKLFRPQHHSVLGIDISSSAVKILEISGSGEALCVDGYGRENLPPFALDGNLIKDTEAVANCIKKVLLKSRLTSKNAALAVPDSVVINKVVQINDGLNDQEMEELVIIEADKYIPYPIDEINLDFEILGHSAKNSAMLDVLIVASRAENVHRRAEVAALAGLTATIIDVESYAVERAALQLAKDLPASGQDKIVAIVDIGMRFCHLFVLDGMKLIFSREEKFGGMQLIEAIAEHYKMTPEQAMEAKEQGTLPNDYDSEVLTPYKEMLLLQIKRTLQFFYSTSQHGFVDHILLAGGGARQYGLDTLIQEQLGVMTTVANPLARMSMNKTINLEAIKNDAPALMVACGLALRNIE